LETVRAIGIYIYRSQAIRLNTPFSFGELPDVKRLFVSLDKGSPEDEENEKRQNSLGNDYDECDDFSNKSGSSQLNKQERLI
jgi:hypothetical protein